MQEVRNLNQAQDLSSNFKLITSADANNKNIRVKKIAPEPKRCKFCGTKLYHEGLVLNGEINYWSPVPRRCTCNQAQEYWSKKEVEKKHKIEEELRQNKRAAMQDSIKKLIGDSGIKKRFLARTFENFIVNIENEKAYKITQTYADQFEQFSKKGIGLYVEGTNGTGKTHLVAAIALKLLNRGVPVIFRTSIDLLADVKKAYIHNSQISEYRIMEIYKNVELLIIDDLGKEQSTEWSMSVLYAILNDRYERMKPTIITTNDNEEMLTNKLAPQGDSTNIEAIISRLHETNLVITMAWGDYRNSVHGTSNQKGEL